MLEIKDPLVARRNAILKGYTAFNDGDWDTLRELLCENVVWHTMEEPSRMITPREGPDGVIAYLMGLRDTTEAKFLGMAVQGDVAVTLDFTYTSLDEGDHACADEIVFDETGCIKEVHHCAAATHRHGSAGQPTVT
jgi:hypothetical protein